MPFTDLDAAWADFKQSTHLTEQPEFDPGTEQFLRMIFSAGASAGLGVITHYVAEGPDTVSLTLVLGQLMTAADLIRADMRRLTKQNT